MAENRERTTWWSVYNYPAFAMGNDGFPRPGQVIQYYRQQKRRADGKRWTQKDLAIVLDLTEQAICLMEKKDIGLESINRRRLLVEILNIPPILLGLSAAPKIQEELSINVVSHKKGVVDIELYETQLQNYWNAHHRSASHERLADIQEIISLLYQILPFSHEKEKIMQLLSRYHILKASIMRDLCLFSEVFEHLGRAIHLTKENSDYEFLADAYYRRGSAYLEQGDGQKAIQSYRSAEKLMKKIPSYMAIGIWNGLGRALATQVQDSQDRIETFKILDQAANLLRISPPPNGNWHHLEIDSDRCYVDKSAAMIDVAYPREALRELSYLRYSSDIQRRNALIYRLQAQAYFALGNYAQACHMAEEGLYIAGTIRSLVNYEHIKELHYQLMQTNFRNNPEVAHLGMQIKKVSKKQHTHE